MNAQYTFNVRSDQKHLTELGDMVPEGGFYWFGSCLTDFTLQLKSTSFRNLSNPSIILNRAKENFGLTPEEFTQLCEDVRQGDMLLFEKVFLSHFSICVGYLKRKYTVSHDDAYDATMDTLLAFRARLASGKIKYGNTRFLYTQMASQHLLRRLKSSRSTSLEQLDLDLIDQTDQRISEEELKLLDKAWSRLSADCQELLKLNYYQSLKLVEVALLLNRKAEAVRKQKERCKNKLLAFFTENKA